MIGRFDYFSRELERRDALDRAVVQRLLDRGACAVQAAGLAAAGSITLAPARRRSLCHVPLMVLRSRPRADAVLNGVRTTVRNDSSRR